MSEKKPTPLNYTPHAVRIYIGDIPAPDTDYIEIQSSGIARLKSSPQTLMESTSAAFGLPIYTPQLFTGIEGLPDLLCFGVIVSMPVAEYLVSRQDLWSGHVFGPDTGPDSAVRDAKGMILGVRRLVMYR